MKYTKSTYEELKEKQEKRYNEFSGKNMFYAFSNKQFDEGLEKIGLTSENYKGKIVSSGYGGYLLKEKDAELIKLMKELDEELSEAIAADQTGNGFILGALRYELANHEYCITYEMDDAINALGLTEADLRKENVKNGLKLALSEYKL